MTRFLVSIGIACLCIVGLGGAAVAYVLLTTPRPTNSKTCFTTSMFHVRLCPGEPSYVRLREISQYARNAVIVAEDGSFYTHRGIDWFELRESFDKNWQSGGFARGGSTITQQLAKNLYLSSEKSILRKVRELLIAIQLEDTLTKDEILEKYLNVVEFGPKIYGISKAARFYFEKPPAQLNVAESAFLAFLLPSPEKYSVSFRKKQLTPFARSQMKKLVERLYKFKKINEPEYQEALFQIASFFGTPTQTPIPTLDSELVEPSAEEFTPEESIFDFTPDPQPNEAPAAAADKD